MPLTAFGAQRERNDSDFDAETLKVGSHQEVFAGVGKRSLCFRADAVGTKEALSRRQGPIRHGLCSRRAPRFDKGKFYASLPRFVKVPLSLCSVLRQRDADAPRRVIVPIALSWAIDLGRWVGARLEEGQQVLAVRLCGQHREEQGKSVFHGAHGSA